MNKRIDLQMMTGDFVFGEFKIDYVQVHVYGETGIVVGQRKSPHKKDNKSAEGEICLG